MASHWYRYNRNKLLEAIQEGSMTFTPGPWVTLKGRYHNGSQLKVISQGGKETLYVMVGGTTEEKRRANARLIAAAPELLESLEAYILPSGHMVGCGLGECVDICRKAREAIAKAHGE